MIGPFYLADSEDMNIAVVYTYVDKDVAYIKEGNKEAEDGWELALSFKKGWNVSYVSDEIFTTTKPENVTFKWYFVDYR